MIALGQAIGNFDFEIALHGFAPVGPQQDLDRHLVAGLHVGVGYPGALDRGHAALRHQVHREAHPRHVRRIDVVEIQAIELVAEPPGQGHGRGHG